MEPLVLGLTALFLVQEPFDLEKRQKEHWAWQPLRRAEGPIDRFILEKLEAAGLTPAPPADRRTLIRRVTFDLIGLPPTPEEVEAFVEDPSPGAFEKVVDRLLASPHFGERWARHWLDLVRYAETRGHEFDYEIPGAHHYRDYVIRALNADLPYDRFVTEHIAGDLLAEPRRDGSGRVNESVLGTAFWHLGEWVHSPVDVRADEAERIDNQIDVMTKAFLGLTVACARCHDHKFDAISMKDYYALAGFLRSSSYRDVRFEWQDHNRGILSELEEAEKAGTGPGAGPGAGPEAVPESDPGAEVIVDSSRPARGDWIADGAAFGSGPARGTVYSSRVGGMLRTRTFEIAAGALWYRVAGSGQAFVVVDSHRLVQGPLHGGTKKKIQAGEGFQWVSHDVNDYWGHLAHVEFTAGDPGDVLQVSEVRQSVRPPVARESPGGPSGSPERTRLAAVFGEVKSRRKELLGRLKDSASAPAMLDGSGVEERVFIRGDHRTPGEVAPRRFLEAIAGAVQPPVGEGSGRLELARRVTDPRNPFFSRVMVNRIWRHLFGRGLVASVDNLGALGEPPTHPQLLDHLANRFIEGGWSVKSLIRSLALTSAYRMDSVSSGRGDEVDPRNLLLHRMPARRLSGEAVRDAILQVSGRLDRTLHGPSVEVHLTPFMEGTGKPEKSGPLDGAGRRSIYLKVRRNFLSPMLLAFDQPVPFSAIGDRTVSNVPAQALILMNDPLVVEEAARWARRALAEGDMPPADRIRRLYRTALGRLPGENELGDALEFLDRQGTWSDLCHVLFNLKEFIFIR